VSYGDELFTVKRNGAVVRCSAPLGGRVVAVNEALRDDASRLRESPYVHGWVFDVNTGYIRPQTGMINSDAAIRQICKFNNRIVGQEAVGMPIALSA